MCLSQTHAPIDGEPDDGFIVSVDRHVRHVLHKLVTKLVEALIGLDALSPSARPSFSSGTLNMHTRIKIQQSDIGRVLAERARQLCCRPTPQGRSAPSGRGREKKQLNEVIHHHTYLALALSLLWQQRAPIAGLDTVCMVAPCA
jgi:hypothetical protein